MGGAEQPGDPLVGAVDGQGVLHQVVGADREEVHFLRELVGHDRRRRHFDHHPDRDVAAEGQSPRPRGPPSRR